MYTKSKAKRTSWSCMVICSTAQCILCRGSNAATLAAYYAEVMLLKLTGCCPQSRANSKINIQSIVMTADNAHSVCTPATLYTDNRRAPYGHLCTALLTAVTHVGGIHLCCSSMLHLRRRQPEGLKFRSDSELNVPFAARCCTSGRRMLLDYCTCDV